MARIWGRHPHKTVFKKNGIPSRSSRLVLDYHADAWAIRTRILRNAIRLRAQSDIPEHEHIIVEGSSTDDGRELVEAAPRNLVTPLSRYA